MISVIRRLFILSALCSVLLAMSQPLLACTLDMATGDCCPAGSHQPDDAASGGLGGHDCPDMLLCIVPLQDAPIVSTQVRQDPQALPASSAPLPDAMPPPGLGPRAPPRTAMHLTPDRPAAFAAATAVLTYLRTARLRL